MFAPPSTIASSRLRQPENAPSPMFSTRAGTCMFFKDSHPSNALESIASSPGEFQRLLTDSSKMPYSRYHTGKKANSIR